jgi:hypothetical protein
MDLKTQELLKVYRGEVEKLARGIYLQTLAVKKELDNSAVNPEDKHRILLHCIGILVNNETKK